MSMIEAFIQELEQESQTTRRVLERVPGDRLGWKPHDKSMSLGQLALHVATTPGGVSDMVRQSPMPVPQFIQPSATSAAFRSGATASEWASEGRALDIQSGCGIWDVEERRLVTRDARCTCRQKSGGSSARFLPQPTSHIRFVERVKLVV